MSSFFTKRDSIIYCTKTIDSFEVILFEKDFELSKNLSWKFQINSLPRKKDIKYILKVIQKKTFFVNSDVFHFFLGQFPYSNFVIFRRFWLTKNYLMNCFFLEALWPLIFFWNIKLYMMKLVWRGHIQLIVWFVS